MNVIQRPRPREFCGTMRDYIIDTDVTITFSVQYGGKTILDEEYVPDANNQVRVRQLGQFCELALWGVWCAGENTPQNDAAGTFIFLINEVEDTRSFVMFSRLQTKKEAVAPGCLTEVQMKVTRPSAKEYVSGYLMPNPSNTNRYGIRITGYSEDGTEQTVFRTIGSASDICSVDVSVDAISSLFTKELTHYKVEMSGGAMTVYIDRTSYAAVWCFRFKNVYDMPETLTAVGLMKLAGGNESDSASMYGIDRKFAVKVTDEYTVGSGVIMLQSDYKLWHNMLNAQEVDILIDGEWFPIVISKQKYEREFRRSVLKTVEFSFRMANPEQNNMIEP